MARLTGLSTNMAAFLDTIAYSEGTDNGKQKTYDDGYDVVVGGGTFKDYSFHPMDRRNSEHLRPVYIKRYRIHSTAAGRYQILRRYANHYMKQLGLPDFGPESQDRIALQLIHECGAEKLIEEGRLRLALIRCKSRWASLPGAGYGQREQRFATLERVYVEKNGSLHDSYKRA